MGDFGDSRGRIPILCVPFLTGVAAGILARRAVAKNGHRALFTLTLALSHQGRGNGRRRTADSGIGDAGVGAEADFGTFDSSRVSQTAISLGPRCAQA